MTDLPSSDSLHRLLQETSGARPGLDQGWTRPESGSQHSIGTPTWMTATQVLGIYLLLSSIDRKLDLK